MAGPAQLELRQPLRHAGIGGESKVVIPCNDQTVINSQRRTVGNRREIRLLPAPRRINKGAAHGVGPLGSRRQRPHRHLIAQMTGLQ